MSNEAVMIEDTGLNPTRRTISNGSEGSDVAKGTLMVLADNNVVSASSGRDEFGGVLASEKVGGDGSTDIGCHMNGVFDMLLASGGTCTVGEQVTISGANTIDAATESEVQLGQWAGYADEAGSSNEIIRVRLRGG